MTKKATSRPPDLQQTPVPVDGWESLCARPIVGIGASAGGLEAFKGLPQHLAADCVLRSLAEDADPVAGGVIFSGTAFDGTQGLRR